MGLAERPDDSNDDGTKNDDVQSGDQTQRQREHQLDPDFGRALFSALICVRMSMQYFSSSTMREMPRAWPSMRFSRLR